MLKGGVLVTRIAPFDYGFLAQEFRRAGPRARRDPIRGRPKRGAAGPAARRGRRPAPRREVDGRGVVGAASVLRGGRGGVRAGRSTGRRAPIPAQGKVHGT